MKVNIRAEIQSMSQGEILNLVPADTITRIKRGDLKPEFRVYCVGEEGVANAQELSFGQKLAKAYHYVKDAVVGLFNKLQYGTPIFVNHSGANTSEGREQVGELVGKAIKNIGDKLSALAVTYIYPQYRKLTLDVASIEGEVEYYAKGNDRGDVIDVLKISAIALGDSRLNTPAFPGATLLGTIQAFTKEKENKMTKEEILEAIKEGSFKVTDFFTKEDIIATDIWKKEKDDAHDHARRVEKLLGDEREKIVTLTRDLESANKKVGELNIQVSQVKIGDMFTKSNETRKFNDKQKAFIERRLGGFKSDKSGNELQLDFDKFLDNEIKEFGEYAKVMGIKVDEPAGDDKTKGAGATDGQGGDKTDLSSPEANDFIPRG